jgi:hypothetical protein
MGPLFSRRAFLTLAGAGLPGLTILNVATNPLLSLVAYAANAYDTLRQAWFNFLTGGAGYNTATSSQ